MAEFFIRGICKTNDCPFVDLYIEFVPNDVHAPTLDQSGRLLIAETDKLSKTIFQIVAGYLQNIEQISGSQCNLSNKQRTLIINTVTSIARDLTYGRQTFPESIPLSSVEISLNREPFIWTIMRSIICPAFDKPLKNIRIVARRSAIMDGAKFMKKDKLPFTESSFVFSNMDIENKSCRTAYLLYEIIRSHEMDPRGVIHEIFEKEELWSKFFGLTKAAFRNKDDINDFITTLSILADEMSSVDKRLLDEKEVTVKEAQSTTGSGSWWYLGLIEKLLEPTRGTDWNNYTGNKDMQDELWERVEEEKKRRGMKELPMELLLRIQSEDYKSQPDLIIQGLLADNRVW